MNADAALSAPPVSSTERLIDALFDQASISRAGPLVTGTGTLDGQAIAILATAERAQIGADLALAMARNVLDVMREAPGRPILIVVDNSGHRLGRWDELMGNNGYLAHLSTCLYLARRRGHRVIGLVNELAVSAGFMALGMATDACYAMPEAEVRVMALNAMSRVTKVPLDRLTELCATSPVLGPGVANFIRVGALRGIWSGDLSAHLREALAEMPGERDTRRELGLERGGRTLARDIAAQVRAGV
ncbi:biotin-independent malonate decarboxylase subunit gamma [Ancylobacter sp. MQZ15Z-1]|uniref:Biotin-independent malonate decarboxylase subunit gamma n=1 Tax=Ancylobacter mangrovi TaxID=2972472 RepID=A0A9X2T3D9_9HYPH|nr:biotin-independent malonate decarboxylase subunit gamma [Ancylobacter mangrovi]MCS0497240.1 biotin-independent malonate decarboxylase subunit gamma [Ancylobacter mangrovi]